MRTPSAFLVLMFAYGLAGCNSRSALLLPTAPTFTSAPTPPPPDPGTVVPQERWNLSGTYIGHTGPEACIPPFDGREREPEDSVVLIYRSGETIHLRTDHDHYVGIVVDDEFSASVIDDIGATWQCGNARLRFHYEGQVSGRFSEDGGALAGEEVALFFLESGDVITRRWTWRATRQ